MKGEELRYLRTLYGMTQTALMRALNLPRRATVAEWEARDRIFKRSGEESHLRLILLSLFKTQVIDSDHCFLTDAGQQDYDRFAQSFVDRIQKMLGEQRRSGGLSIRRRPRRKEWSADLVAV
jgi:transcriptional regulator with XRE-family HTH domain